MDVSLFVRIKLSNVGGSRSLSCVRLFDVLHGTSDLDKVRTLDPNQTRGAVRQIRTSIGLLEQPKSMRSIIDATQREQQYGLV